MPIYHQLGRIPRKRHVAFRKEDGGIQLIAVLPESKAAQAGLLPADVIQRVNKQATRTTADLLGAANDSAGQSITIDFVRKQKVLSLTTEKAPTK